MTAGRFRAVTAVVFVLAAACGGGRANRAATTSSSTTTSTTVAAPTTTATTSPDHGPDAFTSPTGNIGCIFDGSSVRCDVSDHTWQPPPRPADCDLDWGYGLTLDSRGPRFFCAGDTAMGADTRLAYGATAARGGVRCRSERTGVGCVHETSGRGFTLARTTYRFFQQCANVGFTPASEDGAGDVRATGLDCDRAEAFVRQAGKVTSSGGPDTVDVAGYHCVRTDHADDPLPRSDYDCATGDRRVTFTRT